MVAQRFWRKVRVGAPSECWEWQGFRHAKSGYGRWHPSKRGPCVSTHREAWRLTYGEIPEGLCVLHRCDNRPCCNPSHLWLGTKAENNADMRVKGRARNGAQSGRMRPTVGECSPHAKLTDAAVREIRALQARGFGYRRLSRQFGVGHSVMKRVLNGQDWSHVTAERV